MPLAARATLRRKSLFTSALAHLPWEARARTIKRFQVIFDNLVSIRLSWRNNGAALQWLGDIDRDTTEEFLFRFGLNGDQALVADMNGDGFDDAIAVRANGGFLDWYVRYAVPGATPFPTDDSTVSVNASFTFGLDTDLPLVGDFNGDGRADVAAVCAGGGTFTWYVHDADAGATPYPAHPGTGSGQAVDHTYTFGSDTAIPVTGDWDNNGTDNLGVVEDTGAIPANPADWSLDTNFAGGAEITLEYGVEGDQFVVGEWADRQWDGGAATLNWGDAANWDSNTLPINTDEVLIPDLAGTPTIVGNVTVDLTTLKTFEKLNFSSGTFTLQTATAFPQGLDLSGGTLSSNATLSTPSGTTNNWSRRTTRACIHQHRRYQSRNLELYRRREPKPAGRHVSKPRDLQSKRWPTRHSYVGLPESGGRFIQLEWRSSESGFYLFQWFVYQRWDGGNDARRHARLFGDFFQSFYRNGSRQ